MLNNQFVVIPDLTETHLGNPHEVAIFAGTAHITREPSDTIRIPFWTYEQAEDLVALNMEDSTYQAVEDNTEDFTYSDVETAPEIMLGRRLRPTDETQ
jgi:hypothetical protein